MLRLTRLASAVLLSSLLAPCAFAAHTHLATPSTWTLNLHESSFGGGPSMKSDTFVITTDTDKWAKWSDSMVDGDGKTWKSSWSGPENGTAHPFTGMPGAWSTDAATDVGVMTFPDGTVQTCHFSLTSSKRYVEKCVSKSPNGHHTNQTLVYDRTR